MARILKSGGATILSREPVPGKIPASERLHPFHAAQGPHAEDDPLFHCSHYIIYQENVKVPMPKYDMPELKCLPIAWLWESIHNFRLVDPVLFDSQQTCGY